MKNKISFVSKLRYSALVMFLIALCGYIFLDKIISGIIYIVISMGITGVLFAYLTHKMHIRAQSKLLKKIQSVQAQDWQTALKTYLNYLPADSREIYNTIFTQFEKLYLNQTKENLQITKSSSADKIQEYPQSLDNLVISIIDDEQFILDGWKEKLGGENVYYFLSPDDFLLAYNDNPEVQKTNLIVTDYYIGNTPIVKLLDEAMLKQVLGFKGKIFLFSNVVSAQDSKLKFDYIFPSKANYFSKNELLKIYHDLS